MLHIYRCLSLAFFFIMICPFLGRCEEEVRIHLSTHNPLHPIYVGKLQPQQTPFELAYLAKLESILEYDLNYNGSSKVSMRSTEKETLLQSPVLTTSLNPKTWKNLSIPYVLKWTISQKKINATILTSLTGSLKHFNEIVLTGILNQDRRQIHKLADGITKALFQENGVANTRILYSFQAKNSNTDGSEWKSEIWECDWDGSNERQVTSDASYCVTPVLMPPHSQYASDTFFYVSYKLGQPKIYLASIKDGVGKRCINLPGNQLLPAISSKRDKIAFICDASGRADLFLQLLNASTGEMGKPIQLYSYPRSTQASPTFSPDGSKIAFVSDKDGGVRIYLIDTTINKMRPNAKMISKENRENSSPCWSPDGTKLTYSAKTNGIRQIWIYDFNSEEEWQLTSGPGNKENPCWGPDSKHIVFNSTNTASSELYIINLNQPEALKISRGSGNKHYPTWGSR